MARSYPGLSIHGPRGLRVRGWDWRLLTLLLIALLVPAVSRWLVARWPTIHKLELLAYDWHCRSLSRRAPDARIVIVGMDEESLEHLPLKHRTYPLPRTLHARIVDILREAGARVIAFDVMFTRSVPEEDRPFAEAIRRHGRVVTGIEPAEQWVENGEERVTFKEPAPLLRPHVIASSLLVPPELGKVRWFLPYPVDDRTAKRYLHFAVAVVAAYYGEVNQTPVVRRQFQLGHIRAPTGGVGEILVRYAGPPGTFESVPYHEVFSGGWKERDPHLFRDKIVLLGATDPLVDQHDTPVGQMHGVEILAHATQTVLQGTWLRHGGQAANYLAKMALCLLLAASVWKLGLRRGSGMALGVGLLWVIASHQLFVRVGLWVDTVETLGALAATYVLASAIEVRRMRRVFYRFMPSWVAERMLQAPAEEPAQTAEREATVVFCDVRDYTALSEQLPAEVVEELLRRYFTAGEEAARRLGTELDKFVGDEIMLYFEARRGAEPHPLRAVRWALAMQEEAQRISDSGIAGEMGFRVGVGIATGMVRVGTVGARKRIQHTVIGDAVNTASRLQWVAREVGRGIIMSESTFTRVADRVEAERIGEVRVKGKAEPLMIYCPLRVLEA
ncbi:MAG: adenylate/guanylate cyclase domain-containing protein [Armatimonadetes bacterium]|nr:adenylate/guanylate cyclase domain-containing protein [Armatimonadota bacterium]